MRCPNWHLFTPAPPTSTLQVLSLRTFGQRNRLVLSTFEAGPAPLAHDPGNAHRLAGRAAADFGLLSVAGGGGGDSGDGGSGSGGRRGQLPHARQLPEARRAALGALRTAALARLLSMFGNSTRELGGKGRSTGVRGGQ